MGSQTDTTIVPNTEDIVQEVKTPSGEVATIGEIGKSGTFIFSGIISQEEYNRDLIGGKWLEVAEQMRRGDGTVAALLRAIKNPLLGVTWTIQPYDDSAEAIKHADLVRHELFGDKVQFKPFMRESLTAIEMGFAVAEKILAFKSHDGQKYIGLEGIRFRKQRSIYAWETRDGQPGVTQQVLGGIYDIPRHKLFVLTNEQEGENYEGISILRPAYKHWQIKDKLYLIDAIRHERQGLGVVKIMDAPNATSEPRPDDVQNAINAARQLRANEEAYLRQTAGLDMEFMDMKANTTTNVMESVAHHDRQIVKSVLAQFLELGASSGSGSRALSSDHSKLFMLALESIAETFTAAVQQDIINYLIDLNFSNVKGYPKLEHSRIGDDDITEMAEALNKLASANIITPDAELEQSVRSSMHLPDLPEAYKEDYDNRPKATAGTPAPQLTDTTDGRSTKDKDGDSQVSASEAITKAIQARADLLKAIDAEYGKS